MSSFKPVSIRSERRPQKRARRLILAGLVIVGGAVAGYYAYRYFFASGSGRWSQYARYLRDPEELEPYTIKAGQRCGDAPFIFPTTGVIFGMWDQSYRPGHRHSGLDIFAGTEPGETPVYAAYDGYLTRQTDWTSSIIIRHPEDPLHPGQQVWTYYTHMASKQGESFIVDDFPPGTIEEYVKAGTLLGYQGNYSGDPVNPTGLHLHFSVVKDDGSGGYLNELEIKNTYDPSPYLNLPVNHKLNPDEFPVCETEVVQEPLYE